MACQCSPVELLPQEGTGRMLVFSVSRVGFATLDNGVGGLAGPALDLAKTSDRCMLYHVARFSAMPNICIA